MLDWNVLWERGWHDDIAHQIKPGSESSNGKTIYEIASPSVYPSYAPNGTTQQMSVWCMCSLYDLSIIHITSGVCWLIHWRFICVPSAPDSKEADVQHCQKLESAKIDRLSTDRIELSLCITTKKRAWLGIVTEYKKISLFTCWIVRWYLQFRFYMPLHWVQQCGVCK